MINDDDDDDGIGGGDWWTEKQSGHYAVAQQHDTGIIDQQRRIHSIPYISIWNINLRTKTTTKLVRK